MQQNVNNMVVVMYVVLQCSSESTRVFTHLCVLTIKHGRICASNPHMRLKMVASAKTVAYATKIFANAKTVAHITLIQPHMRLKNGRTFIDYRLIFTYAVIL